MSKIIDSLTCAHPTHTIWLSCRIFVLLSIFGFYSFLYHFFLHNLTWSRRNISLTSIINALPLPQTVLLKCSTAIRGSAARYSWDTIILFESHGSQFLASYFNRIMLCYNRRLYRFLKTSSPVPKTSKNLLSKKKSK